MLVKVDAGNFHLNCLADFKLILRFINMPVGDLGDMDEAVNARNNACESAESSHADDFGIDNRINRIIAAEHFPRILVGFFIAKGYLSLFRLKRFDINFNGIAERQHIGRMLDALPRQL